MAKIAFLGMGAMGSRMAASLLRAGHDLTVWNRTPARAEPLRTSGAIVAATPRDAVDGAHAIFSMVRDDAASQAIWLDQETGALAAMGEAAVAVECSTLSLDHVRSLAAAFARRNRAFLDAPLAGSRPQAEAGQLIFVVGGAAAALDRVRPLLDGMGGAVHHAGDNGAGAAVKLMVNALFGAQLALMAELIGFAGKADIDAARAVDIVAATPVCSPAAKMAAQAMLAGSFAPAFPIDLVAKDFGLVLQSAAHASAEMPMSGAAGAVYDRGVAAGFGADNITGIAQLYAAG